MTETRVQIESASLQQATTKIEFNTFKSSSKHESIINQNENQNIFSFFSSTSFLKYALSVTYFECLPIINSAIIINSVMSNPVPASQPPRPYPSTLKSISSLHSNSYQSPNLPYTPKIATVSGESSLMNDTKRGESLEEILNGSNDALSNEEILQNLRCLNKERMMKLEKMCMENLNNYPVFLLYEISCEFNFKSLHQLCIQELVNENYEQLNYSKYDLVKCTKNTFCRILDQYLENLTNLDISGIKISELTNVINDYCVMAGVQENERSGLEKKYVKNGQVGIIGVEGETSRSMENMRRKSVEIGHNNKNKLLLAPPPKLEDSCDEDLTSSRELKENNSPVPPPITSHPSLTKIKESVELPTFSISSTRLKESAHLIKEQIEKYKEKESVLFSEIISTRKEIQNDENTKEIEEGFAKLEKSVENMQNIMKAQNEKIEKLKKHAAIKLNDDKNINQGKSVRGVYGI